MELRERVRAALAENMEHYYCEDCWYSCPKAPDGCCDDSRGDECNCGLEARAERFADIALRVVDSEYQQIGVLIDAKRFVKLEDYNPDDWFGEIQPAFVRVESSHQ